MPVPSSIHSRERLRRRYRPKRVKILFLGESPPASGRFFYQADSGLYRAIKETFIRAFPALKDLEQNPTKADTAFLKAIAAMGCYLVDLCERPVDRLSSQARRRACLAGEARLSTTLRALRPEILVTVVRSIAGNVERAQEKAGWSGQHIVLPYPGRWHQHRAGFVRVLVPLLRRNYSAAAIMRIARGNSCAR
jgi:hypothetical protein